MGFSSVGIGLGTLLTLLLVYINIYDPTIDPTRHRSYSLLMELLAGFGLGGSSMALFGRVGGGIFTKAADVGADLVGKLEYDLDEDDPKNPATIADNVGDNVGDIAGMGSDLFGSFAEASCAALVVIANTDDLIVLKTPLYLPLLISSVGILACFLSSIVGIYLYKVETVKKIQNSLNLQLLISTVLTLIFMFAVLHPLPSEWRHGDDEKMAKNWYAYVCIALGLIGGFLIGVSTDYYTSNSYRPV